MVSNIKKSQSVKFNSGFTLVELLIGLVLSLFIAGIAITYFVSSSRTFRAQTAESVIQENSRFALELMTMNFRLAGMNPGNEDAAAEKLQTIYSANKCAAGEAGLADGAAGTIACTKDGNNPNSDRVAIDYVLRAKNEKIDAKGCNGVDVEVLENSTLHLASVFWTADIDNDGIRSLYCQTLNVDTGQAAGVAVPIVDGIDRLQVQYGVDADKDGLIERYQSFSNLGATNIDKVAAVRIAMLISSGLGVGSDSVTEETKDRSFTLLDAPAEEFKKDYRLRNIFTTTVALPNVPNYVKDQ